MIKILYLLTSCKKVGPVQQTLNIVQNLDRSKFEPYLVTLYHEDERESQLTKFLPYVKHQFVRTDKMSLIFGCSKRLEKVIDEIEPDVIHSLGVFPDFAVSRMKKWKQIITLRNYVYEDYPAKFGWIRGFIMARLHLYAMQHTTKTVTCSESLANIYKDRLGLSFGYVRNGVDVDQYSMPSAKEKVEIRNELALPRNAFIFVYTGQMIERKNVGFLLEAFYNAFKNENVYLLLLGGGAMLDGFRKKYGNEPNIDFRGNVMDVNHYLKACDAYVSTSKSEGLPNGVLEAMATGIPFVLSNIDQHLEIYDADQRSGFVYSQGNKEDFIMKLMEIRRSSTEMAKVAFSAAHLYFSAKGMSEKYQDLYRNIIEA